MITASPERVRRYAETHLSGADREVVLELAGKWRHGYIPLDAVAWAIKMKHQRGDGKRRRGISRGSQDHLEPFRGQGPARPRGKARTDVAEQVRNAQAATQSRGKARAAAREAYIGDAPHRQWMREHPQAAHTPAEYVRMKGSELRDLAGKGDHGAKLEMSRRAEKRGKDIAAGKADLPRSHSVDEHGATMSHAEDKARSEQDRAAMLRGMTTDQLVKHGQSGEPQRLEAIAELKRRQAANDLARADHANITPAEHAAEQKAKRKPSPLYDEYRRLREEQDRRYENQQDSTGAHDTKSEEYQRYFGLGEHMGRGVEQRVTWKSFLEGRRKSPEERDHQAAYDAGLRLGREHGRKGVNGPAADAAYNAAEGQHHADYHDSFAGGYTDGVIHGEQKRAEAEKARAERQAAGTGSSSNRARRVNAESNRKASSQVVGTTINGEVVTVRKTNGKHRVQFDGRSHSAHDTHAEAVAKAHEYVPEHRRADTEAAALEQHRQIQAQAEQDRRARVAAELRQGPHAAEQARVERQVQSLDAMQGRPARSSIAERQAAARKERYNASAASAVSASHAARRTGSANDHNTAEQAHREAGALAASAGATDRAETHRRLADRHAAKARETRAANEQAGLDATAAQWHAEHPNPEGFQIGQKVIARNVGSPGDREATYIGRDVNGKPRIRSTGGGQVRVESVSASSLRHPDKPAAHTDATRPAPAAEAFTPPAGNVAQLKPWASMTPREVHDRLLTDPQAVPMDQLQRLSRLGGQFGPTASREIGRRNDAQMKAQGRDPVAESEALANAIAGPNSWRRAPAASSGATGSSSPAASSSPRITIEHSGDGTTVHGTTREDAPALKRHGFRWSRNLGAWYLPRNQRESTRSYKADQLAKELGDQAHVVRGDLARSGTGEDRAAARITRAQEIAQEQAARAERFRAESDAQHTASARILDNIPMGQPILVGHHSERRHRNDLARADRNMRNAVEAQGNAEHADHRAREAAARARLEEDPRFAGRRADRNQAELNRVNRSLQGADPNHPHTARLQALRQELEQDIARDRAVVAERGNGLGAHNVQPGDLVKTRWGWAVVHKANRKTVTVAHPEERLAAAGYTDKREYHQLVGHKDLAEASPESLRKLLDKPNLPSAVKARIRTLLAEKES